MVGVALAVLMAAGGDPAEEPKDLGLRESTHVTLVPLEVTVWPKDLDSDACVGLTIDDFELTIGAKVRPIYAVDALGVGEETYVPAPNTTDETATPAPGGMSFVLLFDLWHLDLFFRRYSDCPRTKPLSFAEARRFVGTEFHDGDRLLIVTFAGWPVVHYGWIRNRADALAALSRVERDPRVTNPQKAHVHHEEWIAGLESLFLALGRYPGRKDVIYLADDFRFDDVAMRMYDIAARAQANGVVVDSMDLLWACRNSPSFPPNHPMGLGDTEFRVPIALSPLAADTGGRFFRTDRIDQAVHELRAARKCRYLVSFREDPNDRKRSPSVNLKLRGERAKGLTLNRPSSYETVARAPTARERDEALFLIPRFGRGLAAGVTLWPYHPTGKKGNLWKTFVLARVDRTGDEPWPDDLSAINVSVVIHRRSEVFAEFTKAFVGEELRAFREKGGSGLMLFPADRIDPGEITIDLIATTGSTDMSAKVTASFDVPKAPGSGEARPWFLADQLARVGSSAVLAPSLDGIVTPGEIVSFLGYGCASKNDPKDSYAASLVPFAGGEPVPISVVWLDGTVAPGGCGWLAGKVEMLLQPGLWTFKSPAELAGAGAAPVVEFNVVSSTASAGP
jgi:hypothetical protein